MGKVIAGIAVPIVLILVVGIIAWRVTAPKRAHKRERLLEIKLVEANRIFTELLTVRDDFAAMNILTEDAKQDIYAWQNKYRSEINK